ncbi:MAG: hypothetical protein ACLFQX_11855 [Candidatus Kapaibacterium sp.]
MINRFKELDELVQWLLAPGAEAALNPVLRIEGGFGTGKSALIAAALNECRARGMAKMIFQPDKANKFNTLPEFVLGISQRLTVGSIRSNMSNYECITNNTRFPELLRDVRQVDTSLFEKIYLRQYLKTMYDLGNYQCTDQVDPEDEDGRYIMEYIDGYLPTKADKRLLCDTGKVVIESFIVDLMNSVYPVTEVHPSFESYPPEQRPRDIILIMDNYEGIEGSADSWIMNYLLPYFYEKKFGEFESYDISSLEKDLRVADFFNLRVVLSSRNIFPEKKEELWKDFKYGMQRISLDNFPDDLIDEFLVREGVPDENANVAREFTAGNPYLLSLWTDAINLSSYSDDVEMMYHHASKRVLKYFTEPQKDWFICASFMKIIDQSGLKCFPILKEHGEDAFEFFSELSENFIERTDDGMRVRPFIAKLIQESIKSESGETARQMHKIAESYEEVRDLFTEFDADEVDIIRGLAYFDRFDLDFALNKAFSEDAGRAYDLVSRYPAHFAKHGPNYSLDREIKERIRNFNRIIDGPKYEHRRQFVKSIHNEYNQMIGREIDHRKMEIAKYQDRIDRYFQDKDALAETIDSKKAEYVNSEKELFDYNRSLGPIEKQRQFAPAARYFLISIILIAVGLIVSEYSSPGELYGYTDLVRNVFFAAGAVGFVAGAYYLFRAIIQRRSNSEYDKIISEIRRIENARSKHQSEIDGIRRELESEDPAIGKMRQKIEDMNAEIAELEKKLEEPFIQKEQNQG